MKNFNKTYRVIFLGIAVAASSLCQQALARGAAGTSIVGMDIRMRTSNLGSTTLFGWRYLHKPSRLFSLGGAANLGQSNGSTTGSLTYGGLFGAWTPAISENLGLEFGLLAGGLGGLLSNGTVYGGVFLEPEVAFSVGLGPQVAIALNVSYLYIPSSTSGSGVGFGLRFQFHFDAFSTKPE
jgi:hypothetical protein